ncbi:hypothetical protein TIFTF001_047079 [Ficus carica]|uniref:Uncharacterized protein n=1 Tax=Ficus carica TaxID=3494 RepID=A0AA87YW45_FICCA|nr:hypothetical protein TIFTF001_047079 [Ficus carica]
MNDCDRSPVVTYLPQSNLTHVQAGREHQRTRNRPFLLASVTVLLSWLRRHLPSSLSHNNGIPQCDAENDGDDDGDHGCLSSDIPPQDHPQAQEKFDDGPQLARLTRGGADRLIGSDSLPPSDDQDGDVLNCTTTTTTLPSPSSPGSTDGKIVPDREPAEVATLPLGEVIMLQPLPREPRNNLKDSFYCKGESSRSHEFPSSFTSRGTTNSAGIYSLNDDDDDLLLCKESWFWEDHQFTSLSNWASSTHSTVSPVTSNQASQIIISQVSKPITNNLPNSTPTNSSPANENPPFAPSPIQSVLNIFQQQELPKYLLGVAIAFLTAVLVLHYGQPKTITRAMTIVIVLLLLAGVTFLWNSITMQEQNPIFSLWIRNLGYASVLGAIFVLISCFLWPSYSFLAPIACWAISIVILGIQALT